MVCWTWIRFITTTSKSLCNKGCLPTSGHAQPSGDPAAMAGPSRPLTTAVGGSGVVVFFAPPSPAGSRRCASGATARSKVPEPSAQYKKRGCQLSRQACPNISTNAGGEAVLLRIMSYLSGLERSGMFSRTSHLPDIGVGCVRNHARPTYA